MGNETGVKNTETQSNGWFKESLKLAGWTLLLIVTFIGFYQVLPVLLLAMGHILLLLGTGEMAPSAIDAMIFMLTGFSLTAVLTVGFLNVVRRQWRHMRRIRTDLAGRVAQKSRTKKVKK